MYRISLIAVLVCMLIGCEKRKEPLLAEVNGVGLSSTDLKELVDLRIKLLEGRSRSLTVQDVARLRDAYMKSGVDVHITRVLIEQYAAKEGIGVTDEEIGSLEKRMKSGRRMVELVEAMTARERELLRSQMRTEVLINKVRRHVVSKMDRTVSPEEIAKCQTFTAKYNAAMTATNALIYARATNCWQKIAMGGVKYEDAFREYDQSGMPTPEWGEFPMDSFKTDPQLARLLPKMKAGEITPPVEANNGLSIVRLKGLREAKSSSNALVPTIYYHVEQIFFRLPRFVEKMTDERLKREILKERERKAYANLMKKLRKESTIVDHRKDKEVKK